MTPQVTVVRGPEYLRLATTLLQRTRLAVPSGGIWEAADVQWWSRQGRDADGQAFQTAGSQATACSGPIR